MAGQHLRLAFDIETNGLMPDVSVCHSLCIRDLDTGESWSCHDHSGATPFEPWTVERGLKLLREADYLTGHNILSYDIPVLQHLYPWWSPKPSAVIRDTLILAKMIWPVDKLKELDFPRWRKGELPGQLIGAHRLEAWGYRLGKQKGEYSATVKELSKEYAKTGDLSAVPEDYRVLATVDDKGKPCLDPWLAWNRPMQDYCEVDVEVTKALWDLVESHLSGTAKAARGVGWSEAPIQLEHDCWMHIEKQGERGYGFDKDGAVALAAQLKSRQRELEDQLVKVFGSWWHPLDDPKVGKTAARDHSTKMTEFPDITVRKFSEKTGKELKPYVGPPLCHYTTDAPFVRMERITFNPKSRQHLGQGLQDKFGWVPKEFGGKDGDQAKVDETTIKAIPESVLPKATREVILEFLVVSKTLGQLADGKKAWIDLCGEDGRLHGRMDTLGTVSHRASHFDPNLGQVPSVHKEKQADGSERPIEGWKGGFGLECRAQFRPGKTGWEQTGVDASGLELRLLGHYLAPYDEGAFSRRVSTPGLDIHAENGKLTGLGRGATKTVTYAFLYGAGPLKIGLGVGVEEGEIELLANSPAARNYVGWLKRALRQKFVQPDANTLAHVVRGQEVSKKFLAGITGLKDLKKQITDEAMANSFIIAIDGRKLHIRKPHAAINQLLQGGGAVVCKMWLLEADAALQRRGLVEDVDYGQMAWVHDELQFEHREGLHETIKEAAEEAMVITAERLGFHGSLTTEAKVGHNWRDCH